MSNTDAENEFDGVDESEINLQWSPFKQYKESNHVNLALRQSGASLDCNAVNSVIDVAFPEEELEEEKVVEEERKCREESPAEHFTCVPCLASILHLDKPCFYECDLNTQELNVSSANQNQAQLRKAWVWKTLINNFFQKRKIDLLSSSWRGNFLRLLPLMPGSPSVSGKQGAIVSISKHSVGSDDSEDENNEICNKPDPIYSGFAWLRNGFYVSPKGLVFSSKEELQVFNSKMADMEQKLHSELSVIQDQHNKLKAQKAEEKKLLSMKTESQESDQDEEPAESHQLNKENKLKGKTERKSGLFASLSASLSAARSGIQGFWDKSSPTTHRRTTQPVSEDSGDSEDESEKLKYSPNSKLPGSDGLDNHDEFTREMQAQGGLTYKRADKTVQQLSHDALPPPLSLQSLQAANGAK